MAEARNGWLEAPGIIIPAGGAASSPAHGSRCACAGFPEDRPAIQIWHMANGEMSPAMIALMADQQSRPSMHWSSGSEQGEVELGGFELKSFALLNCAFREVVLLDADNVPLIDPEDLFTQPAFRESGAMFWPDLGRSRHPPASGSCAVSPTGLMPSFESGQLAVDRGKHFHALALSWFLNRTRGSSIATSMRQGTAYSLPGWPLDGRLSSHHSSRAEGRWQPLPASSGRAQHVPASQPAKVDAAWRGTGDRRLHRGGAMPRLIWPTSGRGETAACFNRPAPDGEMIALAREPDGTAGLPPRNRIGPQRTDRAPRGQPGAAAGKASPMVAVA